MTEEAIRLYLQAKLEEAFPGFSVTYRPPGNVRLARPCIVYNKKNLITSHANNTVYVLGAEFQVTMLTDSPGDSRVSDMVRLTGVVIRPNRSDIIDEVAHDVFTITVNSL